MIFGQYTIAELRDLLAAKDYSVKQLTDSFNAFSPAWGTFDQPAMQAFWKDLQALTSRYQSARQAAQAAITLSDGTQVVSDTLVPADAPYRGVLRSLQKTSGVVSSGDIADLDARLRNAGKPTDYSSMPQPAPGSDADQTAYQLSDATIKQVIEPASRAAASGLAAIPWPVWAGLFGIAGIAVYSAIKR